MPGKPDRFESSNRMKKSTFSRYIILGTGIMLFIQIFIVSAAFAEENAVLSDIRLANTRDDLITYFNVEGAFTDKINQAVLNGIPTSFSFYVVLYKIKDTWFDKKMADVEFKSTLKYNSLKKEFVVSRPWKSEKPIVTKSFDEARQLMTEVNNVRVIPINDVVKGEKYQIRIKAELDKVKLPLYLHYVLFFLSFWDFETDWYLINFTY